MLKYLLNLHCECETVDKWQMRSALKYYLWGCVHTELRLDFTLLPGKFVLFFYSLSQLSCSRVLIHEFLDSAGRSVKSFTERYWALEEGLQQLSTTSIVQVNRLKFQTCKMWNVQVPPALFEKVIKSIKQNSLEFANFELSGQITTCEIAVWFA